MAVTAQSHFILWFWMDRAWSRQVHATEVALCYGYWFARKSCLGCQTMGHMSDCRLRQFCLLLPFWLGRKARQSIIRSTTKENKPICLSLCHDGENQWWTGSKSFWDEGSMCIMRWTASPPSSLSQKYCWYCAQALFGYWSITYTYYGSSFILSWGRTPRQIPSNIKTVRMSRILIHKVLHFWCAKRSFKLDCW